ncbi:hypothetical protein SFC07_03610 [Corynebacterium callunae]|uniref:hypothetical protein n=1 Tax=Corynebacterium callunae TaxID=1721 RepID=UPI00398195FA
MSKDPARIPAVLAELQETWEGQPELSLATLFGILANNGVGWGSEDEDLVRQLQIMRKQFPASLQGPVIDMRERYVVETENPQNLVTVDPYRIVVRPLNQVRQPGIWEYRHIKAFVGAPLHIEDRAGTTHHLGTTVRIRLVDEKPLPQVDQLNNMKQQDIGDQVFLVLLEDGSYVLIERNLSVFVEQRCSVDKQKFKWVKLAECAVGKELKVQSNTGMLTIKGGNVVQIIHIDA